MVERQLRTRQAFGVLGGIVFLKKNDVILLIKIFMAPNIEIHLIASISTTLFIRRFHV